mgnify:CR=1 FL=1
MADIIKLIIDYGIAVVVVGYFIYKDYKFNNTLVATLQSIRDYMHDNAKNNGGRK